ncbi:MAG: hypothetical protein U9N84_05245 [Actinomycetota bacterium]|nr:hypothetical protein [Actinomycetota bacterium]
MTEVSARPSIRWGAVAIGAMAGLVVALFSFIVLGVTGLVARGRGDVFLLFLQFLALIVAGYVAGRLSESAEVHGGLAGLLAALVSGLISLSTNRVPLAGIITLTVIAAVLGSAGGLLARWQREKDAA